MREMEQELQQYKTGVGCPSFSRGEIYDSSLSSVSRAEIARDESSRPSQTVETAFVPCEACHRFVFFCVSWFAVPLLGFLTDIGNE